MATRSRNPNLNSVGCNLERILRDSRTLGDATSPLRNPDMEGHLATLLVTNL